MNSYTEEDCFPDAENRFSGEKILADRTPAI
jgi:hypothetical protein